MCVLYVQNSCLTGSGCSAGQMTGQTDSVLWSPQLCPDDNRCGYRYGLNGYPCGCLRGYRYGPNGYPCGCRYGPNGYRYGCHYGYTGHKFCSGGTGNYSDGTGYMDASGLQNVADFQYGSGSQYGSDLQYGSGSRYGSDFQYGSGSRYGSDFQYGSDLQHGSGSRYGPVSQSRLSLPGFLLLSGIKDR